MLLRSLRLVMERVPALWLARRAIRARAQVVPVVMAAVSEAPVRELHEVVANRATNIIMILIFFMILEFYCFLAIENYNFSKGKPFFIVLQR